MRDAISEFLSYNLPFAKRNPELYRVKIARMAADPFAFFRGTFHLYASDVINRILEPIPLMSGEGVEMDIVGDIHSENFGTYQAADAKIYYFVNDFDETVLGRTDFDVCRLAISVLLASRVRKDSLADSVAVVLTALTAYVQALPGMLKKTKEGIVSDTAPSGCPDIDELVQAAKLHKRSEFIGRLTEMVNGQRRIIRSANYFNLRDDQREQVNRLLADYVTRSQKPAFPDFYKLEDACGRVAGIGSMGRLRYAALVNGKGSKDGRAVLLEFKESKPSAYDVQRNRNTDAAAQLQRAEQVISRMKEMQVQSNAHLGWAVDNGISFQVREIGPHDARVNLTALKNVKRWEKVASVQFTLLACAHARAIARATGFTDPLAELRDADAFCNRVLTYALAYADLVRRDWTRFAGQSKELEQWGG